MTSSRAELPIELVHSAQAGNRQAQTVVLKRYAPMLHQLVRRIAGSDHDPENLTQSVLQRLLVVLPKFDPAGAAKLTTWVVTVAHHFLIDELRKSQLRLVPVPIEQAARVGDDRQDPHQSLWQTQVREALEKAIAELPTEQRRVFVLVHLHEHSLEAVAEAEGVPLGTVKSRLFRARARLAQQLSPQFTPGGDDADR